MRLSFELIGVSLALDGESIRIQCVVFNIRLTITLRRRPVRSRSYRDFALPQNNAVSADADAPPPPTGDLLIVVAQPPGSTSH